jgi:phospholipase/carboxylesterase
MMNSSPEKDKINGWHFRVKRPPVLSDKTQILLLLHGYLGNEDVMWTLTKPIPDTYLMLAPRAPVKMGSDQYSWHEISPQWPSINTYQTLTEDLLNHVQSWMDREGMVMSEYNLMGFSQGAVMAYALAILHPEVVRKVAALAGFIPHSWKKQLTSAPFTHQEFFIAHGKNDDIVPIKKARQTVNWLEEKNAQVTFCEADIGHKISADCFNGLGKFFANDR